MRPCFKEQKLTRLLFYQESWSVFGLKGSKDDQDMLSVFGALISLKETKFEYKITVIKR